MSALHPREGGVEDSQREEPVLERDLAEHSGWHDEVGRRSRTKLWGWGGARAAATGAAAWRSPWGPHPASSQQAEFRGLPFRV